MFRAITSFRGEAPRVAPQDLPDNAAQDATNARLLTGDLTAWKQFVLTEALANTGPVQTIYKLNGAWLSWDADVDVARGVIPGDTTFRTYLTAPSIYAEPRFTTYALATGGTEPWPFETRPLGVPAPDSVPTIVLGVDPTPTTFSIDITDHGDVLATSWVVSPPILGSTYSSVTQDAGVGDPAPSYKVMYDEIHNPGQQPSAYRNFGISSATVVQAQTEFMFGGDTSFMQAKFIAQCDESGVGPGVSIVAGTLSLILNTSPNPYAAAVLATAAISPALSAGVWYTAKVNIVTNSDGTKTITGSVFNGSTQLATVTATNTYTPGDFCGFTNAIPHDAGSQFTTYYDNIHVQASGSTNAVIVNLATSYVFTFVNDLGEESAPSLPSATVTRPDGVSATVTTATSVPTGIDSGYGITTKRIYRAATGNTGTAFLFVAEIPLAQADYVDTLTDAQLGAVLPSDIWALPPDDLQGILALPNGVMVGFRRNQLCFSAQNQPHAWPVEYRLNTDTDIVGIGNIDNTVVIGTGSFVYVATGNDPAAYSMGKFEVPYAAMSKRSFAYLTGIGVVFAGTNGLMAVAGIGQVRNLTETVFTDTQWKALSPENMHAVSHNDIYFVHWDNGIDKGCYAIDMKSTGFGITPMSFHASAMYDDPVGDVMYLVLDEMTEPDDPSLPIPPSTPHYIDGTHIYEFEGSDTEFMTYRWRGKLWLLERPAVMLIAQLRAAGYANILLRLYGDGVQIDEAVIADETEFTLAVPDEAYTTLEYEVLGTSTIRVIQAAEDVSELE